VSSMTIRPAPVRRSFTVKATPERAFEVFTAGIHHWWPHTHSIGASPQTMAVIEPRVGGRWYEIGEDGSECPWGDVLTWEPPGRLVLAWRINAEFKFDPALHTEVEVRFTAEGPNATRIEFEHRLLENLGERAPAVRESLNGGWAGIVDLYAKAAEG
jgi:uncharacterized protein YndB with AHSA1/START domain